MNNGQQREPFQTKYKIIDTDLLKEEEGIVSQMEGISRALDGCQQRSMQIIEAHKELQEIGRTLKNCQEQLQALGQQRQSLMERAIRLEKVMVVEVPKKVEIIRPN